MDAKTKKAVRKTIKDRIGGADKVMFKQDGTIVFKRSYFYRHGYSAEKFGTHIEAQLRAIDLKPVSVETRDAWAPWPRDSFFVATVRLEG